TAGGWVGKDWIVLSGLNAGDKVIVDNIIKLRPGATVSPHAPGEMPAAPAAPGASSKPAKQA
ncbi:MAG: efflux transporter periplasmic adaptor subunit, partial [Methylophilaceae bacterium]